MKTQELVHVHALLLEVRLSLERADDADPDAFAAYDAQPIRPHDIHQQKTVHRRAIDLLLEGIDRSIRPDPLREHPPSA
jgi:hypothetical protein